MENRHILRIDTSKSDSNRETLQLCIKSLGWKEIDEDDQECDLAWYAMNAPENFREVKAKMINKFPGMKTLANKVPLTKCLSRMRKLFPDLYDFYPKSWYLPQQYEIFADSYFSSKTDAGRNDPCWYIAKPDDGARGENILLFDRIEHLWTTGRYEFRRQKSLVVQEYVKNPLLIDGRKFDFRIFVLIENLNPLILHIGKNGIARFCTSVYEKPTTENRTITNMHITNYAINKHKIGDQCNVAGAKRSIDKVLLDLETAGVADVKKLWRQIRCLVTRTVISILPDLMICSANQLNAADKKCFQILGFDILLTSDCKPLLLEINYSPNLSINTSGDKSTIDNQLDLEIKTPIIKDTLLLMTGRISASDEPCCWSPLFSALDSLRYSKSRTIFMSRVAELFISLAKIEERTCLSLEELMEFLRNCYLTPFIDGFDLMRYFDDSEYGSEMISFDGFLEILLYIAAKKYPASKTEKPGDQLRKLLCYCQMRDIAAKISSRSSVSTGTSFSIPRWKTIHDLPSLSTSTTRPRQTFWWSTQQTDVRHRFGSSTAAPGPIAVVL